MEIFGHELGIFEIIVIIIIALLLVRIIYNVIKLQKMKADLESHKKVLVNGKIVDNENYREYDENSDNTVSDNTVSDNTVSGNDDSSSNDS